MDDKHRNASNDPQSSQNSRRPSAHHRTGEGTRQVTQSSHPASRTSSTPFAPSLNAFSSSDPQEEKSTIRRPTTSFQVPISTQGNTMSRQTSGNAGRSQHYQLVSPGTPADPRTMSQVSPGFVFVIFLCLRVLRCPVLFISCSFLLLRSCRLRAFGFCRCSSNA